MHLKGRSDILILILFVAIFASFATLIVLSSGGDQILTFAHQPIEKGTHADNESNILHVLKVAQGGNGKKVKTTTSTTTTVTTTTTTNSTTVSSTSTMTTTTTTTTNTINTTTAQNQHLDYGAEVHSLSYSNVMSATWQGVEDELQLLKGMGVRNYVIHLSFDPWLTNRPDKIGIVDQAVQWIHANNGTLHLVDAGAERFRTNKVTWEDFKSVFKYRISLWAERYHPEIMTTIKEPRWYVPLIKDWTPNATEFIGLSYELNSIVKSISPDTLTMYEENADLGIGAKYVFIMFKMTLNDPNLDMIGVNTFGYQCGQDTQTQYLGPAIAATRNAGKEVWISETWGTTAEYLDSCPNSSNVEIEWAQHISSYAANYSIPVVEWFFTQQFGTASNPSETYIGIMEVMQQYN